MLIMSPCSSFSFVFEVNSLFEKFKNVIYINFLHRARTAEDISAREFSYVRSTGTINAFLSVFLSEKGYSFILSGMSLYYRREESSFKINTMFSKLEEFFIFYIYIIILVLDRNFI